MKELITGHTKLICLLGTPVGHSISPLMHNEAFAQLNLDYAYMAFDVNTNTLKTAVEGLKAIQVAGFNLTMPCKNLMYELVDEVTPAAKIIGAVNTVINQNGKLTGHITDGTGFMMAAKDAGHDIIGKKMTLLGAGGAATAILVQAALDGVSEISVFNMRDPFFDRAQKTVDMLNETTNCTVTLYDFSDPSVLKREISNSHILVNGTTVGMSPNIDSCIIEDTSVFHNDLIVSDVIYTPKETKLLRLAREAGCQTFNGLYMLLYQGAEAFKIWTGQEMPVELIKQKYFQ